MSIAPPSGAQAIVWFLAVAIPHLPIFHLLAFSLQGLCTRQNSLQAGSKREQIRRPRIWHSLLLAAGVGVATLTFARWLSPMLAQQTAFLVVTVTWLLVAKRGA